MKLTLADGKKTGVEVGQVVQKSMRVIATFPWSYGTFTKGHEKADECGSFSLNFTFSHGPAMKIYEGELDSI